MVESPHQLEDKKVFVTVRNLRLRILPLSLLWFDLAAGTRPPCTINSGKFGLGSLVHKDHMIRYQNIGGASTTVPCNVRDIDLKGYHPLVTDFWYFVEIYYRLGVIGGRLAFRQAQIVAAREHIFVF